jgi:hypothetical protein
VHHPEVVSGVAASSYFSPNDQRIHRLFGVDNFLQVQRVEPAEGSEPAVEK